MDEWQLVRIEEIARKIAMGPFGSNIKVETFVPTGVPIISGQHLHGSRLDERAGFKFITQEHADRLKNSNVFQGDVIFTHAGTIGQVALIPQTAAYERYVLSQRQFYLRVDKSKADPAFIARWFHSPIGRHRLLMHASQVGVPSISRPASNLKAIEIALPTLREQKAISAILDLLDDKIELNRRMNETLEAMARAIFRDWFVDFGPTRAKAEGRPPYLAPEIWDLFPDVLDDEDKPVGWELSEIGKEVVAVGGATPSTKEPSYWEGGIYHWATPKDLSKLTSPVLLNTDRRITDAGVGKISSGLLPVGTVLLSSRAPIGYLAIAEVPTAVNQGFIAMVCRKRLPNVFVLFWCYENLDHIKSISGGSTFAEISKKAFRPIPVTVPSEDVIAAYEQLVRPLYDRIVANVKEANSLAQTRDLLLPKLMSGEISLLNADRVVEAVA